MTLPTTRTKQLLAAVLFLLVCAGTVFYHLAKGTKEPKTDNNKLIMPDVSSTTLDHPAASLPQNAAIEEKAEALPAISPAMAKEIRQLTATSPVESMQYVNKDGSVSTMMQTRSHSVTAATLGSDGKIIIRHGEEFLNNISDETAGK